MCATVRRMFDGLGKLIKSDLIVFGLHGGAQWPGGAIDPYKHELFISTCLATLTCAIQTYIFYINIQHLCKTNNNTER